MDVFTSVEEGIKGIHKLHPDLVFLDVQINNKTGFDLLKQFGEVNFDVIFATAFDKYGVQAFKFSAIDYLLKPVDADDLKIALEKLSHKFSKDEMSRKLDVLFQHSMLNKQGGKRISISTQTELVFLNTNEIVRCQSDVNYTIIYTKDKRKIVASKTLKEFEELLEEFGFFRVHNSHLINLSCIKTYIKGKGGTLIMQDNTEIEVSIRRKEEFIQRLETI